MSDNDYDARLAAQRAEWRKKQAAEKALRERRKLERLAKIEEAGTTSENAVAQRDDESRPLAIVTSKLFVNESNLRQQEIAEEVVAFYDTGRDDIFFSIADQALDQAIASDIENYLKRLVEISEGGSVDAVVFKFKIVHAVLSAADRVIASFESHTTYLTEARNILSNPDYEGSVVTLIKEKINRYLKLFETRNINVVDVYTKATPHSSGHAYEEHVGGVFDKAGWAVARTPASGDQGADLVCEKEDLKLVVQCKFYTGNVGNSAVQEVHAARGFYDASYAAVVSNAGFTSSAVALAEKLGVLLVPDDKLEKFVTGNLS